MRYYLMLCEHFCYHDSLFEDESIHLLESTHTDERTKEHSPWLNASGFTPHPLYPRGKSLRYAMLGCFRSLSGRFGEGRNSLLLLEIEPRFFSRLIHNLFIHNDWEIPRPTA